MNQKRLIALIDANVLIPENLGSFLATCAYTGCITPVGATLHSFPMAIGTTRAWLTCVHNVPMVPYIT
jgi:hypothetical protein